MGLKDLVLGNSRVSSMVRRASLVAVAAALLVGSAAPASADEYVSGYYRSSGRYVEGYYRTERDGLTSNNYSYYGNYNPYTGVRGTHRDDSFSSASDRYGQPSSWSSWSSSDASYGGYSFGRGRR